MPSLRKKVAEFIRQLSVTNQAENVLSDPTDSAGESSGCFIQRYLSGHDVREQPEPLILHGRNPHELPGKPLGALGPQPIFAALTGPDGGLTTVNRRQRHLSTSDPDVDYIDIQDNQQNVPPNNLVIASSGDRRHKGGVPTSGSSDCVFSPGYGRWFTIRATPLHPIDNSVMHIRAAGSVFSVGTRSVHTSVSDLLPELGVELNGNELPEDEEQEDDASLDILIPPPAEYATGSTMTTVATTTSGNISSIRKSKSAPLSSNHHHSQCNNMHKGANGDKPQQQREGEIAGVVGGWQRGHSRAWGAATTLYERHPLTGQHAGSPIADCFAVVARRNSAILALADGVNWGEKACVAARSAVHGCVEYLNKAIFGPAAVNISNTTEVFVSLLRSFHAAHSLILQEAGMLTTLTAALVLPLGDPDHYVVCVCNVGDSLAYVYSAQHGVREITKGSHDIHCMRDMRDALGALGPVDGQNPELNNLTCSMTEVKSGDIVFLTSDGVSDNFDPVVGKFAVLPPSADNGNLKGSLKPVPTVPPSPKESLPTVQAYQRHELSLLRMDDLLRNGVSGSDPPCKDAQILCEMLLDFATRLTAAKRHILEDRDLYCTTTGEEVTELSRGEQRARRRKVCEKLAMVPGKLDHATVVAYQVGLYKGENEEKGKGEAATSSDDLLIETVL